jgi:hypothetical protein
MTRDEHDYSRYLAQLRSELSELDDFPASLHPQVVILALGLAALLATILGILRLPVPGYLLIPFVAIPGWRIFVAESERRTKRRATANQIRAILARSDAGERL